MTNLTPLKQSTLFNGMSVAEIVALGGFFNEKLMPEGMTVFVENMPGESLFLIQEGAIQISKMLAEGDEKTLVILGAEDIFGEMAILDSAPRSATARVAEAARLLSIRRADYEVLCEQNPRLALKLTLNIVRVFSRRIREIDDEYREMLFWSLKKQA
jgi:CRP-like cAMP-binding protein